YPNNPGGISNVTITAVPASIACEAQLTEWRNVAIASPLDTTGTTTVNTNQLTATVSTSLATTAANDLVITSDALLTSAGMTIVPAAGWTSLVNDPTNGLSSEYRLDLPAAVATETLTTTVATRFSLVMAAFKPAAGAATGAVLDPGFYYFNGSGFAGGGGICLNGGTLLARDTTLEFVNSAGF